MGNVSDELVVIQGSELYRHLMANNIHDFEVREMASKSHLNIAVNPKPVKLNRISKSDQLMFKHFLEQILSCELLISEDSQLLEMTLGDYESSPESSRDYVASISYGLIGSCLIWRYRSSPFLQLLVLTPAFAYCGQYLYHKYKDYSTRVELQQFLEILKRLQKTFRKSMKIIQDYSVLIGKSESASIDHLKQSTAVILYDTINYLLKCKSGLSEIIAAYLIPSFLLIETDLSELNIDDEKDINKLYYVYLIVQSELLRFLGLTYSFQFWKDPKTKSQVQLFHKTALRNVVLALEERCNRAQDTLKLFQSVDNKKRVLLKAIQPNQNIYVNLYQMTLKLHSMLTKSWDVTAQLETELPPTQVSVIQDKIESLQSELKSINEFLNITKIQLSRLNHAKPEPITPVPPVQDIKVIDLEKIENVVQDQIFELHIKASNETEQDKHYTSDDELKKAHAKATKAMIQELEKVLVFKREEWNEREAKIKQLLDDDSTKYDTQTTTSEPNEDVNKKQLQFRHKIKKSDSRQSESSSSDENNANETVQQYFGPRSTTHVLPHPRRISKYKNVRDKNQKPKKMVMKASNNRESTESNDDSDIPQRKIGFGNILPPIAASFRQDEESLSAVGELSDSDPTNYKAA